VADPAHPSSQAIQDDRGVTSELAGMPARELAERVAGGVEVLLLWHSDLDLVELSLYDQASGAGCQVVVPPEHAIDAFYHPYVYAMACDDHREAEDEATINGG
jgi:hypothetical protein